MSFVDAERLRAVLRRYAPPLTVAQVEAILSEAAELDALRVSESHVDVAPVSRRLGKAKR
ncbi:hypothetical protein G4O51_11970 [Candidatus Bathyarchaeota archaeon A05DMB-2]|nr:hypothetical protein [Candidatus Bathyarchaeota archaeon A05DMB-2]